MKSSENSSDISKQEESTSSPEVTIRKNTNIKRKKRPVSLGSSSDEQRKTLPTRPVSMSFDNTNFAMNCSGNNLIQITERDFIFKNLTEIFSKNQPSVVNKRNDSKDDFVENSSSVSDLTENQSTSNGNIDESPIKFAELRKQFQNEIEDENKFSQNSQLAPKGVTSIEESSKSPTTKKVESSASNVKDYENQSSLNEIITERSTSFAEVRRQLQNKIEDENKFSQNSQLASKEIKLIKESSKSPSRKKAESSASNVEVTKNKTSSTENTNDVEQSSSSISHTNEKTSEKQPSIINKINDSRDCLVERSLSFSDLTEIQNNYKDESTEEQASSDEDTESEFEKIFNENQSICGKNKDIDNSQHEQIITHSESPQLPNILENTNDQNHESNSSMNTQNNTEKDGLTTDRSKNLQQTFLNNETKGHNMHNTNSEKSTLENQTLSQNINHNLNKSTEQNFKQDNTHVYGKINKPHENKKQSSSGLSDDDNKLESTPQSYSQNHEQNSNSSETTGYSNGPAKPSRSFASIKSDNNIQTNSLPIASPRYTSKNTGTVPELPERNYTLSSSNTGSTTNSENSKSESYEDTETSSDNIYAAITPSDSPLISQDSIGTTTEQPKDLRNDRQQENNMNYTPEKTDNESYSSGNNYKTTDKTFDKLSSDKKHTFSSNILRKAKMKLAYALQQKSSSVPMIAGLTISTTYSAMMYAKNPAEFLTMIINISNPRIYIPAAIVMSLFAISIISFTRTQVKVKSKLPKGVECNQKFFEAIILDQESVEKCIRSMKVVFDNNSTITFIDANKYGMIGAATKRFRSTIARPMIANQVVALFSLTTTFLLTKYLDLGLEGSAKYFTAFDPKNIELMVFSIITTALTISLMYSFIHYYKKTEVAKISISQDEIIEDNNVAYAKDYNKQFSTEAKNKYSDNLTLKTKLQKDASLNIVSAVLEHYNSDRVTIFSPKQKSA